MNVKPALTLAVLPLAFTVHAENRGDMRDLDDLARWNMLPMEACLDQVLDTVPGHPRKVELKVEGDDPIYEFDIQTKHGIYNVECNAEEGMVTEIEREVAADDALFKKLANVSEDEAREMALAVHPGRVTASEREIGSDGTATYEFDIQTEIGYEVKVDVDADTGKIQEANIEIYEIGPEDE